MKSESSSTEQSPLPGRKQWTLDVTLDRPVSVSHYREALEEIEKVAPDSAKLAFSATTRQIVVSAYWEEDLPIFEQEGVKILTSATGILVDTPYGPIFNSDWKGLLSLIKAYEHD